MKKFTLFVVATLFAVVTQAQNWEIVNDSVDSDAYTYYTYSTGYGSLTIEDRSYREPGNYDLYIGLPNTSKKEKRNFLKSNCTYVPVKCIFYDDAGNPEGFVILKANHYWNHKSIYSDIHIYGQKNKIGKVVDYLQHRIGQVCISVKQDGFISEIEVPCTLKM